jgi:hypothetical protein
LFFSHPEKQSRFLDCIDTEEEGSKLLHNVGKILAVDVVSYLKSLSTLLLDPQTSQGTLFASSVPLLSNWMSSIFH